ncbi:MAG: hypothetical protein AAB393_03980 [Bacteroidota bacterium]
MRIHETEQNLVAMPEMKSTPATESPISAEVLRTVEAFDALYPEWDALFRATGSSVFQSFEWLRTWWRHFGEHSPDMSLHVVVMRGDTRIVGIAPLFVETVHILGFLSFRKVAFISREMSDLSMCSLRKDWSSNAPTSLQRIFATAHHPSISFYWRMLRTIP